MNTDPDKTSQKTTCNNKIYIYLYNKAPFFQAGLDESVLKQVASVLAGIS